MFNQENFVTLTAASFENSRICKRSSCETLKEPWWSNMPIGSFNYSSRIYFWENIFLRKSLESNSNKVALRFGYGGLYAEKVTFQSFMEGFYEIVVGKYKARLVFNEGDYQVNDNETMTKVEQEFYWDDGAVFFSGDKCSVSVTFVTDDQKAYEELDDYCQKNITKKKQGSVYMLVSDGGSLCFNSIGIGGHPLERNNYEPEVLVAYDRICEDIKAVKPKGRLSILDGVWGTGKSFCLRGLLNDVSGVAFVIVPPHALANVADPSYLSAITDFRQRVNCPIVFLVEDADECLAARENGNLSALSMVLNLGDGILGSVLDIRIVATTNAKVQDLDPAVKRPGRLTVFQTIGPLSVETAKKVFKRLCPEVSDEVVNQNFKEPCELAEVYKRANDPSWKGTKEIKKVALGFGR